MENLSETQWRQLFETLEASGKEDRCFVLVVENPAVLFGAISLSHGLHKPKNEAAVEVVEILFGIGASAQLQPLGIVPGFPRLIKSAS